MDFDDFLEMVSVMSSKVIYTCTGDFFKHANNIMLCCSDRTAKIKQPKVKTYM